MKLKSDYQPGIFPKLCNRCGRSYFEAEWRELELVGITPATVPGIGRLGPDLELRNCICHSTFSAELAAEEELVNG